MGALIIDEKDALERLESDRNLSNLFEKAGIGHGGGSGSGRHHGEKSNGGGVNATQAPEDVKILAGAFAMAENAKISAEIFGLNGAMVGYHKKGMPNRTEVNEEFREKVIEKKEEILIPIREKALKVVSDALESISKEDFTNAKLRDKAAVAKDIATVVDKLSPKHGGSGVAIQFHIHAPAPRAEKEYRVIDVEVQGSEK